MYDLLEFLVWGKRSKTYRRLISSKRRVAKRSRRMIISDRAWVGISGRLYRELPRDEAISVLNLIKKYAVEQ